MIKFFRLITIIIIVASSSQLSAETYSTYRSAQVELIKIDYELAQKVKPIIRTFVSRQGHVATVKGSDYMILADTKKSIDKLKLILENLDKESFDQEGFRKLLSKVWYSRAKPELNTITIDLEKLKTQDVIPAIRALVSKIGNVDFGKQDNQIVITDFPDYVKEVERMIIKLDS